MAYMNQEKKAVIKANLDKVLKPLGIKYGLTVRDHMSINCTLKSGPINFIQNYKAQTNRDYIQVNPYYVSDSFDGQAANVINQVIDALKSADWFDKSDAMTDYFHTAYYMHLNVGSWDKPYQVVEGK